MTNEPDAGAGRFANGLARIRRRRGWSELSTAERGLAVSAAVVQLGLLAAALRDVSRRPAAALSAPKPVWVAACFVNFVGPIAYFLLGRRRRAR